MEIDEPINVDRWVFQAFCVEQPLSFITMECFGENDGKKTGVKYIFECSFNRFDEQFNFEKSNTFNLFRK